MCGVEAHVWMRVRDTGAGNPPVDQTKKPSPGQRPTLASSPQGAKPVPKDLTAEDVQTIHIARHRVVVEPALDNRAQPLPELRDWYVPPIPKLRLQRFQFG